MTRLDIQSKQLFRPDLLDFMHNHRQNCSIKTLPLVALIKDTTIQDQSTDNCWENATKFD